MNANLHQSTTICQNLFAPCTRQWTACNSRPEHLARSFHQVRELPIQGSKAQMTSSCDQIRAMLLAKGNLLHLTEKLHSMQYLHSLKIGHPFHCLMRPTCCHGSYNFCKHMVRVPNPGTKASKWCEESVELTAELNRLNRSLPNLQLGPLGHLHSRSHRRFGSTWQTWIMYCLHRIRCRFV